MVVLMSLHEADKSVYHSPMTLTDQDTTPYAERRKRVQDSMRHGIAIIPTAPEVARNADTHYGYRHDSNFYYLSGFT